MPEWVLPILLGVIAASGAYLTFIATRKQGDRERIKTLEARQDVMDQRNLAWQNYAQVLRQHINLGKPPPAPDFPDDLFK